jgi:hypothetical protein
MSFPGIAGGQQMKKAAFAAFFIAGWNVTAPGS